MTTTINNNKKIINNNSNNNNNNIFNNNNNNNNNSSAIFSIFFFPPPPPGNPRARGEGNLRWRPDNPHGDNHFIRVSFFCLFFVCVCVCRCVGVCVCGCVWVWVCTCVCVDVCVCRCVWVWACVCGCQQSWALAVFLFFWPYRKLFLKSPLPVTLFWRQSYIFFKKPTQINLLENAKKIFSLVMILKNTTSAQCAQVCVCVCVWGGVKVGKNLPPPGSGIWLIFPPSPSFCRYPTAYSNNMNCVWNIRPTNPPNGKVRDAQSWGHFRYFWVMSQQRQYSRKDNFGSSNARVSERDFWYRACEVFF